MRSSTSASSASALCSRAGWTWVSGADTPLGEEQELYRLTFQGAAGERSVEVGQSAYLYTAAERATDGAGPVDIELVQLGSHAASRPATISIS